ncbi:MAG: hypothetical protein MUE74_09825, partial [Bacteroidales bacterium]|nr:hypothetical protein [Bacteroidales bacterium]
LESAFSTVFSFYLKNFLPLFLTTFVVTAGIQFLSSTIDLSSIAGITDPVEMMNTLSKWIGPMLGALAVSMVLYLILQYFIIFKPVDSSVNIFTSVYKSLIFLPAFLIIMIFFSVFALAAMTAGVIVFFIGILFSVMYVFMIGLFILPVLMTEGNNIGNAIGRTFTLSHRHFGPNLGWTALLLLLIIVAAIILSSLVLIPFSGNFLKIMTNPEEAAEAMTFMSNPWYIVLSALASSLTTPLAPIMGAVLYFNSKAREDDSQVIHEQNDDQGRVKVEDLYARPYADDHPDNPDNKQ